MKHLITSLLVLSAVFVFGQKSEPTLKSVLLAQMKSTHTEKDWFVPVTTAVEGLTAEQAMWTDGSGNHSVGQLAFHLVFWNERSLAKFKGEKVAEFSGNNEESFDNKLDAKSWAELVKKLDQVMIGWEKAIEAADEKKLKDSYSTIANINTHNAYHTGQMIFVRKLQGSWNPDKGVK